MKIDAVVLAGRRNEGALRDLSDEVLEANIDVAGRPMVSYILDSLSNCEEVGRIFLVGPKDGLSHYQSSKITLLEHKETLLDNVKIGLDAVTTELALICASDTPLLTPGILRDFIARCVETGADFCYPVSSMEDCDRVFPGVQRTYLTLREGTFTGGNIFFVRKSAVSDAWPYVEKMIEFRKNPLKMASVLGYGLLIKVAMKVASVTEIERRVENLLRIKPKAILHAPPEVGVDVDKPSDLELCRRILAK